MRRVGVLGLAGVVLVFATSVPALADPPLLSAPAKMAKDNDALPRLAAPASPGAAKINAALARVDQSWRGFMRDCRSRAGAGAYLTRSVRVTMAGPKVVSFLVTDEADCGGAHPSGGTMALAYDLETGRPLDWTRLLPARMVRSATSDSGDDGTKIGAVVSPILHDLYLKAVKAASTHRAQWASDCGEVLADDELGFQLWPDAAKDAVVLEPFDLPHAVAACADDVPVSTATLRRLGVNPALLEAIDAAHGKRP